MIDYLFKDVDSLVRVAGVGVLAYVALVLLLRISGKRTLSKMNAFDLVVTIAMGSVLATVLLNKDVTLAEGIVAFALLIGLQFVVTWSSVRIAWIRKLVTGEPTLLLYEGGLIPAAMKRTRVTEDELHAALRAANVAVVQDAYSVVLETDGSLTVLTGTPESGMSTLTYVRNADSATSAAA